MIKVEGHNDLYRDESTGAIINMGSDYDKYMRVRSIRKQRVEENKQEIDSLRSEIADLKQMMVHLLDKINEK